MWGPNVPSDEIGYSGKGGMREVILALVDDILEGSVFAFLVSTVDALLGCFEEKLCIGQLMQE